MSETATGPSFTRLPVIELVDDMETEIVHQISHADRHNDRLIGRHFPQRAPIEMIEMRVRHENEIDLGQMMNLKPGCFRRLITLSHFAQFGSMSRLTSCVCIKKRRVPDPGNADFAVLELSEIAAAHDSPARLVKSDGMRTLVRKLRLCQSALRTQTHPRRAFVLSTVAGSLANDVAPAFFGKRNRHVRRTI